MLFFSNQSRLFVGYFGWINGPRTERIPYACPPTNFSACNQFYNIAPNGVKTPNVVNQPTLFPSGNSDLFPIGPIRIQWETSITASSTISWYLNGYKVTADPSNPLTRCPQVFSVVFGFNTYDDAGSTKRQSRELLSSKLANLRATVAAKTKISLARATVVQPVATKPVLNITVFPPITRTSLTPPKSRGKRQAALSDVAEITTADAAAKLLRGSLDDEEDNIISESLAQNGLDLAQDSTAYQFIIPSKPERITDVPSSASTVSDIFRTVFSFALYSVVLIALFD
jgi:hypothetical protein